MCGGGVGDADLGTAGFGEGGSYCETDAPRAAGYEGVFVGLGDEGGRRGVGGLGENHFEGSK